MGADLIARYNYSDFTRENVLPLLRFDESPAVGQRAPDFPLWRLDGSQTSLSEIWSNHSYTVVEFGSFT
jgi:hypothetical protein